MYVHKSAGAYPKALDPMEVKLQMIVRVLGTKSWVLWKRRKCS